MAGSVLGGGKLLKGGFNAFKTGYRVFNPKNKCWQELYHHNM